jgi:hypothetical protein
VESSRTSASTVGRDIHKVSLHPSFICSICKAVLTASGNVCTRLRSSLDPTNLEMIVFLHENMEKVKMTYDSTIIANPGNQAAGQPVDPVVNID